MGFGDVYKRQDMRQIPGQLYNFDETFTVSKEEGAKWHLIQTMAGDQTDGYKGLEGVGVKRATALFEKNGYSWKTVVDAFKEKGYTQLTALVNAQLARILTVDDYDFEKKKPIPWNPSPNYKVDDGTGSKDEAA